MSDLREPLLLEPKYRNTSQIQTSSRRKVLGAIGLTATALCASSTSASAGWFSKTKSNDTPSINIKTSKTSKRVGNFPAEWERMEGRNIENYANFINSLKMNNITAQDVISAHAKKRGNCWNRLPPKKWWARMGYTLRVVDRISDMMDVPVKEIVSAYRSPKYNARCAGAKKRSWHQANVALDVKFETSARYVTQTARAVRKRGLFKGGVGSYSSFTHIDTRGTNVNW